MQVLVVDDSKISRRALRAVLEEDGYLVEEADTGRSALRHVENAPPDLITLDINLPDKDGFEVCRELRSEKYAERIRAIPVVFVTACDTLEGRVRGFEVGAADFVTKSRGPAQILQAVNRILRPDEGLRGTLAVIVDDSPVSRRLVRGHLTEHGVKVLEGSDGREGLAIVRKFFPEVDLVITDMMMPGVTGAEMCSRIRQNPDWADLPVIILSAVDEKESILELFNAGATDYIHKPYIKEELIARLNSHLRVGLLKKKLEARYEDLRRLNQLKDQYLESYSKVVSEPMREASKSLEKVVASPELSDDLRAKLNEILAVNAQSAEFVNSLVADLTSWTVRMDKHEQ